MHAITSAAALLLLAWHWRRDVARARMHSLKGVNECMFRSSSVSLRSDPIADAGPGDGGRPYYVDEAARGGGAGK